MSTEIKKFIVHLYFGKFYHLEKICDMLVKKYDTIMSEEQVEKFVLACENFFQQFKE